MTERKFPRDEADRSAAWIFGLTIVYVALYAGAVYIWIFT